MLATSYKEVIVAAKTIVDSTSNSHGTGNLIEAAQYGNAGIYICKISPTPFAKWKTIYI